MTPSSTPSSDAGLVALAVAADSPAPERPAAPDQAPAGPSSINYKAEARSLWQLIAGGFGLRFASVKAIYTDQALDELAAAWAPVLERHSLDMGKFTVYLVAAGATLPVLGQTAAAIKAELAAERKPAGATAEPAQAAPAAAIGDAPAVEGEGRQAPLRPV